MYVDVESLLVEWLQAKFPTVRVVTERPASLGTAGGPAVVQVERISGGSRVLSLDSAVVDVDCYALATDGASSRAAARGLSYAVMAALQAQLPGYTAGTSTVTAVTAPGGPTWRAYDNTSVRRFGLSVTVTVHSPNVT